MSQPQADPPTVEELLTIRGQLLLAKAQIYNAWRRLGNNPLHVDPPPAVSNTADLIQAVNQRIGELTE